MEAHDAPGGLGLDDPEVARLVLGHRDDRHRGLALPVDVRRDHLADVHLVDVIAAEDGHQLGLLVGDHVLALIDRVGRPFEPRLAGPLLGGDGLDELIEDR